MSEALATKFGNARIGDVGYYRISSHKEGNYGKLLHRLIFEDYYQIKLDEEFSEKILIHHEDGNPLNNEIWNLVPMTRAEHHRLHKKGNQDAKGVVRSDETRRKMSIHQNKTGIRNVSINKNPIYKQGFKYRYTYYENGKQKAISSVDLDKLKEKVLAKGFEWEEYSKEKGVI